MMLGSHLVIVAAAKRRLHLISSVDDVLQRVFVVISFSSLFTSANASGSTGCGKGKYGYAGL